MENFPKKIPQNVNVSQKTSLEAQNPPKWGQNFQSVYTESYNTIQHGTDTAKCNGSHTSAISEKEEKLRSL